MFSLGQEKLGSKTNLYVNSNYYAGKNYWLIKAIDLNRGRGIKVLENLSIIQKTIKLFYEGLKLDFNDTELEINNLYKKEETEKKKWQMREKENYSKENKLKKDDVVGFDKVIEERNEVEEKSMIVNTIEKQQDYNNNTNNTNIITNNTNILTNNNSNTNANNIKINILSNLQNNIKIDKHNSAQEFPINCTLSPDYRNNKIITEEKSLKNMNIKLIKSSNKLTLSNENIITNNINKIISVDGVSDYINNSNGNSNGNGNGLYMENDNTNNYISNNKEYRDSKDIKTQEEKKKKLSNDVRRCQTILIQKYLERPLLYKGRKFDIRIWVLLTHKMEVYMFK